MTGEIGALKELSLNPGDVVECVSSCREWWTVGKEYTSPSDRYGDMVITDDSGGAWQFALGNKFRVVSRASDKPRTWGEMTDAEKGALLLHEYQAGEKSIQYRIPNLNDPSWGEKMPYEPFNDEYIYRIKPEPVRDTVTVSGFNCENFCGWAFGDAHEDDTCSVIFSTIDGKPITGTFINEDGEKIIVEALK